MSNDPIAHLWHFCGRPIEDVQLDLRGNIGVTPGLISMHSVLSKADEKLASILFITRKVRTSHVLLRLGMGKDDLALIGFFGHFFGFWPHKGLVKEFHNTGHVSPARFLRTLARCFDDVSTSDLTSPRRVAPPLSHVAMLIPS